MHSRNNFLRPLMREKLAPLGRDPKIASHQRLRRGCSQADNQFRLNRGQFGFEPWPAGGNLDSIRLCMNAPLTALDKLEMLYGIRDINFFPVESGFVHRFAEQPSRRSHEGVALAVLLIPGLLTYHYDLGILGTFPEDNLGRVLVQIATSALRRGCSQLTKVMSCGNPRRGRFSLLTWHSFQSD